MACAQTIKKYSFANLDLVFPSAFPTQFLRDEDQKMSESERMEDIRFHIKNDDYFVTLATVIDLMLQEKTKYEKRQNELLEKLRDELLLLQKKCNIVHKK